ncbi:MAG: DUF599 domain-containing protein [Methyloligellaceae bacterium]
MSDLTTADLIAISWFFVCVLGYSAATRYGPLADTGLVRAMNMRRLDWMQNMAGRENRMVDIQVIAALSRGNGFFASTAILVTGALAALFGAADDIQTILQDFPYVARMTRAVWEIKVVFLMAIFIYAFFKFAWAFRLSHYTAIMVGATPIATEPQEQDCLDQAARAARLAGIAGAHANAGLRAYYFGMAGLGWFIHPAVFVVAVTMVIMVLYRREYHSRALGIISADKGNPQRSP